MPVKGSCKQNDLASKGLLKAPKRGLMGPPAPPCPTPQRIQPRTRRQTCSLDCSACGSVVCCFSTHGVAASQVTLMPRTKHLSRCAHLCAPFKLFDPLFALCLPLLVPLFSLPLDSPPPISMAGTWASGGPLGPHRASALCNSIEPIDPLLSSAFHSLSTQ